MSVPGTMLTTLPESIALNILANWLDLKSIAALDSAHCAKHSRKEFLSTLKSLTVPHVDLVGTPVVTWLLQHKISAASVRVRHESAFQALLVSQFFELNAKHVRSVRFWHRLGSHNADFPSTARHCHQLTDLCTGRVAVSALSELLHRNQNLQSLLTHLEDAAPDAFATLSLPHLTLLSVATSDASHIPQVAALIASTERLQRLNISQFHPTSSNTMVLDTHLPHLKCLKFLHIDNIDAQLAHIASLCPNIVHLDLEANKGLTDQGILHVAQGMRHLRSINLSSCKQLTDVCMQHLAQHCAHSLKLVFLGRNPQISRVGMDVLRSASDNRCVVHCRADCGNSEDLSDIMRACKATIVVYPVWYANIHSVHVCDSVEIVEYVLGTNLKSFTKQSLARLRINWPRLHTVVVGGMTVEQAKDWALHLPDVKFISENSAKYDVMTEPI